jgi:hypothetical protein
MVVFLILYCFQMRIIMNEYILNTEVQYYKGVYNNPKQFEYYKLLSKNFMVFLVFWMNKTNITVLLQACFKKIVCSTIHGILSLKYNMVIRSQRIWNYLLHVVL